MRFLAVDFGSKRIGVSVSDPFGIMANPLVIFSHVSRSKDTDVIIKYANELKIATIIIGQSLDEDGLPNVEGRRAARFASRLRKKINIPVILWDEAFSTQDAKEARIAMNVPRRKRRGHVDHLAATVLLQSYLDSQPLNYSIDNQE